MSISLDKTKLKYSDNIVAVHATRHQISNITKKLVKPKSDCFLIKDLKGNYKKEKIINSGDELIKDTFEYIENSGISIKRPDSKSYQIHKFTPSSFLKVFDNDKCLGTGAMIYTRDKEDFNKNDQIIQTLRLNLIDFFQYFLKLV